MSRDYSEGCVMASIDGAQALHFVVIWSVGNPLLSPYTGFTSPFGQTGENLKPLRLALRHRFRGLFGPGERRLGELVLNFIVEPGRVKFRVTQKSQLVFTKLFEV